jgi:DNA helicase II / ATP-dependent DNA helicase PcrA
MRRLDPAQAAAARSDAPVQLTLAGPGSGKTSTLTGRFVYLTRQGVDPHRILAVTFTRKAADEMRSRIARLLELSAPASLEVMTFHAFAFRLLKRNPAIAGLPDQFQLWDAPEQRRVFSSQRMYWNEAADILDIIGGAKERLFDAETFAASIDPADEVLAEAVKYFRVYEHALDQAGAIDFADMVPLVAKAMAEDAAYRQTITSAYDHVLVDEYQDVNPGQIKLLDHFVCDGVRLWVVGDDDQTLYSFRASDVRHVLDFTNRHSGAVMHLLDRNYRSAPEIVRAARRLIGHNRARMDKVCHPVVSTPGEIVIRGYATPVIEARQIARAIVELIGRGAASDSIAVLYRSGAIGLAFQGILQELGVPFVVRGGADFWQSAAARLAHGALIYLHDGESAEAISRIGSNKRGEIVRGQLDRLPAAIRGDFEVSAEHVRDIVGGAVPGRASAREKAEWYAIVDAVVELALTCKTLPQLENKIADQSRTLRNLPDNAIVLSTIHSAKGLEWDTVFLAGLEDGVLPHINAENVEEERRIAYVGLTRAKYRLGITYAAMRYGEKARPSPFLFEIAGKNDQNCAWSGPRTKGADDRLPLLRAEDLNRRTGRPAEGVSAMHAPQPKRTGAPSRSRAGKSRRDRRRTEPLGSS